MEDTLTPEVLQDDIAVSLARSIAVANKRAQELGINLLQSLITITEYYLHDNKFWRINYGPRDYVGRRGGDLIIEVDFQNAAINKVLWGQ